MNKTTYMNEFANLIKGNEKIRVFLYWNNEDGICQWLDTSEQVWADGTCICQARDALKKRADSYELVRDERNEDDTTAAMDWWSWYRANSQGYDLLCLLPSQSNLIEKQITLEEHPTEPKEESLRALRRMLIENLSEH